MSGWVISESKIKRSFLLANHQNRSPIPPPPSFSSDQKQSSNRISPAVLFIIVILAVIFFISGLLHLLVRFLLKQPQSASNSNRNPEISSTDALQRQLQQLFNLHDSGLDQAFIDSLPVFHYKSILGLKEPFDCAVCLCEFAEEDQLRLLPNCSHAFHLDCIDTWLLSNSTCPLCRGALFSCDFPLIDENPSLDFSDSRIEERFAGGDGGEDGFCSGFLAQKSVEMGVNREEIVGVAVPDKKIVPVKLGKFRSLNDGGETSSSNLDARRCYSMGSFQYVLGSSNLQIALFPNNSSVEGGDGDQKQREPNENSAVNLDLEGKKLSSRSKMESFSVSKIWLWPKKGKYPSSSDENNNNMDNNMDNSSWIEQHRTRTR